MRTIIACEIFKNIIEPNVKPDDQLHYLPIDEHLQPEVLRSKIQLLIDQSNTDEIIMLYGICGNATVGLQSGKHQLRLLRVHDCTAVLLGSNQRFMELFGENLSQGWTCETYYHSSKSSKGSLFSQKNGLLSTLFDYIETYGEDNGNYLWELLKGDNSVYYITFKHANDQTVIDEINEKKTKFITKILDGDPTMINQIMNGDYHQTVFVPINSIVMAKYDLNEVLYSVEQ